MNEMYLTVFLISFSEGLISIFVPIYFYTLGYPIEDILLYYLILSISNIVLSYFLVKVISKIGVKHSISMSIPFLIIYFLGLTLITKFSFLFYILPIILAIRTIFYNIGYHLNYLEHSNAKKRGKEVSILVSLPLLASLLSPFLGGVAISLLGYEYLYAIGAIILASSIIPLFLTNDQKEKMNFTIPDVYKFIFEKKQRNIMKSFFGYATTATIGVVIWPIFLTNLSLSTEVIGTITSLTAILTLIIFFIITKKETAEKREKIIKKRTLLHTLGWLARIFATSAISVFVIDAYKKLLYKLLQVEWSAYTYELAKKQNYFKFIVAREIAFNLSRIVFIPILMLIFSFFDYSFTLAFVVASLLSLLYPLIIKRIV
jgi:predicted MFS family arabinose efflux permease